MTSDLTLKITHSTGQSDPNKIEIALCCPIEVIRPFREGSRLALTPSGKESAVRLRRRHSYRGDPPEADPVLLTQPDRGGQGAPLVIHSVSFPPTVRDSGFLRGAVQKLTARAGGYR